jgi:hypothetical protein
MIKHCLLISLLFIPVLAGSEPITTPPDIMKIFNTPVEPETRLWRDTFVQVTYDKQNIGGSVQYNYHIANIGDVSIGTIIIGYARDLAGCQIPPANVNKLTTSMQEWIAKLEIQTENPDECITAKNLSHDYPLEPGQTLTITADLNQDNAIFENLYWEIIFTRAPTRLHGEVKRAE